MAAVGVRRAIAVRETPEPQKAGAEVLPPGKATSIGVSSGDNRAPGDNQPIALASLPRSEHDLPRTGIFEKYERWPPV